MILYVNFNKLLILFFTVLVLFSCDTSENPEEINNEIDTILADTSPTGQTGSAACISDQVLDMTRGKCEIELVFSSVVNEEINGIQRKITSNSIPDHLVGLFGPFQEALNPNEIKEQSTVLRITANPEIADEFTPLLSSTGPAYSFGILLNGVELDPVAAEPFPHEGMMSPNLNWEWNLEATNVLIGLDCNNAHVQPTGKYHYHGPPVLYLENAKISADKMTLIGYAGDGFPIYYKYAYSDPTDNSSPIIEINSSYRLKEGERPGDGINAPCGTYDGVYSNDYEYIEDLGILDEANGRTGVTPEYPSGTYYYILTDDFPKIPRYFRGIPSNDFKI